MTSSTSKSRNYPPCPDGGWGWMVVFGSFMIHVIADGVMYSFGLFYYELAKHFGATKTATSMIVSIMNGTTYCIGPIASALTIRFGCRTVTIAGSIFASAGFFLSTFTSNIYLLYNTIGICAGFGFGLIVTSYFEKKRAFATGIAVCGSGIGTAIMSPLIEYLIQLYGWKGAMLVISALLLNCAIFGALFKPLKPIAIDQEKSSLATESKFVDGQEDIKLIEKEQKRIESESITISEPLTSSKKNHPLMKPSTLRKESHHHLTVFPSIFHPSNALSTQSSINISNENQETSGLDQTSQRKQRSHSFSPGFLYREDSFYSGSLMNIANYKSRSESIKNLKSLPSTNRKECCLFRCFSCPDEIRENISEMIDLTLMKDHIFLIFSLSNFFTSIGFYIPYIYLKDWIVENEIGSPKETGFYTSIIGLFSTISRLVFGYLSDRSFINRLWLYIVSVTISGLIIISNTIATTHLLLVSFCAFFGITCGTYVSLTSVVLVDLLGLKKLTNAFGLILLFQGIASILGPLFIGFIHDLSGAYDSGFQIIGTLVVLSGLMLIFIPICNHFESLKKWFFY
ncbi:WASH complex subunit FAM21C [Sarcoptes scabiei]|nr:WASH complex subunit FAM21C [Sarcoptes scabiei]